jgi:autotransporter-associated beta strand protein
VPRGRIMFRPLRWLVIATAFALPTAAFAQVQVNQNFVTQGPAPAFGPTGVSRSADAPPNGTVTGAIGPVVADPGNANRFFIGTTNGGIWTTIDGGTTWTPLSDKQASLSIASLSLDPTDPNRNTLIAGTGLTSNGSACRTFFVCFFTGSGGLRNGLLYSQDGGNSWTSLGAASLGGQTVDAVAARGNTLIAGTFELSNVITSAAAAQRRVGGLYRSPDGGATFTLISGTGGLPTGPVSSIVGDPNNSNRIYAAVSSPSAATNAQTALFVSNDAGVNWTPVFGVAQSGGTISAASQTVLKVASAPGGALAVGVVDLATRRVTGLFWSGNSGTSWTPLAMPALTNVSMAPANFAITIDPKNTNLVYVSGDTLPAVSSVTAFRIDAVNSPGTAMSITDGNTANASTVHADSRSLTFDANGRLVLTSDGGIYARTSPGNNTGAWTSLNGNVSVFETYAVGYDAVGKRLIAAAQDNGVAIQSGRNNLLWNAVHGADGINAFVNDVTLAAAGQTAFYKNSQFLGFMSRIVLDAQGNQISPNTANPDQALGANVTCNGGFACSQVVGVSPFGPWVNNRVDPTRMALGGTRVNVTQDTLTGAQGPGAAAVDLTLTDLGSAGGAFDFLTAIAYGTRDNPNMLVAGGEGGLFQSTRAAAGSLVRVPTYTAAGGVAPSAIVLDPRSQLRYFVADNINLFGTTNQGTTITNLTGNLPAGINRPTALEFISNNGVNTLLVGGLNNVADAQSTIAAADSDAIGNLANWRPFGTGLPNSQVSVLAYNPAVDLLAVGTFGRGVFTLYDVTSYFPQATVLQFGLADNDSLPDASFLTNGTVGNRALIKYGTGTLTIAGDATYTGGTTINGGVLQLGIGGTSGSILGDVAFCSNPADSRCDPTNNKLLAFNRSDAYAFGGSITGPGQVFQIGSGKTILTGNSTYSGPTFVNNGTLSVNGSITSSVFVNFGGTLGGNGVVGPSGILAGGTLSPGNSVGTLTVNGNLVFAAASLYMVEVQGNTADRTNASGTATLAGTVGVANLGGIPVHSYTILSAAAGRTGTFESMTALNLPAFLTASLAYTPTDVQLNLTSGIGQITGLTLNQSAVAAALDNSFNTGGGTLPGLLGLSLAQLPAALDALSGEGVSGTQETALGAAGMFTSIMMDQGAFWRNGESIDVNGVAFAGEPLQYAPSKKSKMSDHPAFKEMAPPAPYKPRWRAWLTGFDGAFKLAGEAGIGSADLSHNTGGLAGGLDYQFAPDVLLGLAIGGSSSNFSVRDRITSGHLEGAHVGGYGVKTWGPLYAAGALSFGTFRNSETRSIAGIGPTETATGSFGSNLFSGRVEVGAKQVFGRFAVTPFAAVQFAELWQNGFTETNPVPAGAAGPLGLTYGSISVSSLPTFVGAQLDTRLPFGNGMVLSPYARLSWVHEFNPTRAIDATFIALPGAAFTVDGPRASSDAARIDAGAKLAIGPNAWLYASFDGEFSDRGQSYAGKGGVRIAW